MHRDRRALVKGPRMSTALDITITGWLGSDVQYWPAKDGLAAYATFRVGSTHRYRSPADQAWKDTPTEWFQVKAWRMLAVNANLSLAKGTPVVVKGRLSTREYTDANGASRTSLVLEAAAIGPDLAWGSAPNFERTVHGAGGYPVEDQRPDRSAQPTDVSGLEEAPQDYSFEPDADAGDPLGQAVPDDASGLTAVPA